MRSRSRAERPTGSRSQLFRVVGGLVDHVEQLVDADLVARRLVGRIPARDGDEVRENLSKGLGFSKEDRDTNIRRIGFVADLLARNGVIAITAAISPYREIRDENRKRSKAPFVEIYVEAPLAVVEERDTKGLYKKARAGIIKQFTGISDPYEEPLHPEVTVHVYEADHGFNCDHRGSYDAAAARLARERTLAFFNQQLG